MLKKLLLPLLLFSATLPSFVADETEKTEENTMSKTKKALIGAAGIAGTAAVAYCIYYLVKIEQQSNSSSGVIVVQDDNQDDDLAGLINQQVQGNSKNIQRILASKSTLEFGKTTNDNNDGQSRIINA